MSDKDFPVAIGCLLAGFLWLCIEIFDMGVARGRLEAARECPAKQSGQRLLSSTQQPHDGGWDGYGGDQPPQSRIDDNHQTTIRRKG